MFKRVPDNRALDRVVAMTTHVVMVTHRASPLSTPSRNFFTLYSEAKRARRTNVDASTYFVFIFELKNIKIIDRHALKILVLW